MVRSATRSIIAACTAALAMSGASQVFAVLPSFPGAEGFGGTFAGSAPAGGWFSTAQVYHVTTTADTINPATNKPAIGTLRGAFYDYTNPNSPKQMASNRIIVFDVGGTFQLTQGSLDIKTVNNIYVAGQTAPSPVVVYGDTTQITKSNNTMTSNVVLRYMTFRKGAGNGEDAITFAGGSGAGDTIATNMILDHVSASWSEDENLSVANNNTNVTVQYSIISDSLVNSHAYGSLVRPQVDSSVTYHHNLYANNASRQPRLGSYNGARLTADVRNNVIYNWRDRASYAGGSSEAEQEQVDVNYAGNYLVAGPSTTSNLNTAFVVDKNVDVRAYQSGNFIDSDKQVNPGGIPNGSDTGWAMWSFGVGQTDQTLVQMGSPFATANVTTQSAANAYNQVIGYVGNYWWQRDAFDTRVLNNVKNNTNPPSGVAASAPNAAELNAVLTNPSTARPAGFDTDGDGMSDAWEIAHGLNPNSAADKGLDFDSDGYVNVVEYLNDLGAFPAPAPIVFTGATSTRYALNDNWSIWQPSRFDEVQVNSGTATVDAVGQHAGTLKVATNGGDVATLSITGGWIDVAQSLLVGPGGNGTVIQTGGSVAAAAGVVVGKLGGGSSSVYTLASGSFAAPSIALLGGGRMELTATGNKVLTTGALSIDTANNSTLDLSNNDAIVTATPQAVIEGYVASARNGGAWNGGGITSSTARDNAGHNTGLAVVSGADYTSVGGNGTFAGRAYNPSDVLIKYTWNGDANIDGRVTFDDYVKIDTGFNTGLTGWVNGDFNYSGAVNFDDYVLIDVAFNSQNGTLQRAIDWISGDDRSESGRTATGVAEVIAHLDQFGAAYGQAFLAAVPEPGALSVVAGVQVLSCVASRRYRKRRAGDIASNA